MRARPSVLVFHCVFLSIALAMGACAAGQPISRDSALKKAAHAPNVHSVQRSEAKLMSWSEWLEASGSRDAPVPAPPDRLQVWVVALYGSVGLRGSAIRKRGLVVILNGTTGTVVEELAGTWDWPPYWDKLPDHSGG